MLSLCGPVFFVLWHSSVSYTQTTIMLTQLTSLLCLQTAQTKLCIVKLLRLGTIQPHWLLFTIYSTHSYPRGVDSKAITTVCISVYCNIYILAYPSVLTGQGPYLFCSSGSVDNHWQLGQKLPAISSSSHQQDRRHS